MNEKVLPKPEQESQKYDKKVVILAGGVVDKEKYSEEIEKVSRDNAIQIWEIHSHMHSDLMNLQIQQYEKRDLPSTNIDDALRVISSYDHLELMPKDAPISLDQINNFTYEMLLSAEQHLPGGITPEDVANIWEWSIQNFQSLMRFMTVEELKNYEEVARNLPSGITLEDLANIGDWSMEKIQPLLKSVTLEKLRDYAEVVMRVQNFWRQLSYKLKEKRKPQEEKK